MYWLRCVREDPALIDLTGDVKLVKPDEIVDGRYRIEKVIGEGGMGVVFKAHDQHLNRDVAIKMLHAETLTNGWLKRFRREASSLAKLHHPNLVKIYRTGFHQGSPYLCMEFVEGLSMRDILNTESRIPWKRLVALIRQVCAGLACAHENGIVHRDIKPNNVLVLSEESGESVRVIDFGLCSAGLDEQKLTQTGTLMGSLYYMSPEQCRGKKVDKRSDVYSVGCLFYEALCGVLPFEADNPIGIIHQHLGQPPRPPRERYPELDSPTDLEHLIMSMLEKDPALRIASVEKVIEKIDQIEGNGSVQSITQEFSQKRVTTATPGLVAGRTNRRAPKLAITGVLFTCLIVLALCDPGPIIPLIGVPTDKSGCNSYIEASIWLANHWHKKAAMVLLERVASCSAKSAREERLVACTALAEAYSGDYQMAKATSLANKIIAEISKGNGDNTGDKVLHTQKRLVLLIPRCLRILEKTNDCDFFTLHNQCLRLGEVAIGDGYNDETLEVYNAFLRLAKHIRGKHSTEFARTAIATSVDRFRSNLDPKSAVEIMDEALRIRRDEGHGMFPDEVLPLFWRGRYFVRTGNLRRASQDFEKLRAYHSASVPLMIGVFYGEYAIASGDVDSLRFAQSNLEASLSSPGVGFPEEYRRHLLGQIYLLRFMKDPAARIELAFKLRELIKPPESCLIRAKLAECFQKVGNFSAAEREFKQALPIARSWLSSRLRADLCVSTYDPSVDPGGWHLPQSSGYAATLAPQSSFPPGEKILPTGMSNIAGRWSTNYGFVDFKIVSVSASGIVRVEGVFNPEDPTSIVGDFDGTAFNLKFFEPQNRHGTWVATFDSATGKCRGHWKYLDGGHGAGGIDSGAWDMTRSDQNAASASIALWIAYLSAKGRGAEAKSWAIFSSNIESLVDPAKLK